jgi:hypothetical protein
MGNPLLQSTSETLYLANFNIWFCPAADWRELNAAIQREMTAKKSRQ